MSTLQETSTVVEPGTAVGYDGMFYNADGVLADPDKVGFAIINPARQQTNFVHGIHQEVAKIAVGHYRFTISPTSSGEYEIQIAGSGAIAVTGRVKFRVGETQFQENWLATAGA